MKPMLRNCTLRITFIMISAIIGLSHTNAQVSSLSEPFDSLPSTWTNINNSEPVGTTSWFHPSDVIETFEAHSGDSTAYVAANFQNTSANDSGNISTWLLTPELSLVNGGVLKFWTRTEEGSLYPDRLEVRLSTNDSSIDVGTTDTSVGVFTTLLVSINDSLQVSGYPEEWTEYTIVLSGVAENSTGRIAFRYYVTDAGFTAINSSYIGLDDVSYNAILPVTFNSFNGTIKDNKVLLNWSTSNEINNKGYDVERSINGKDFSAIGFVKSNGNTSGVTNYAYTDASKLPSGVLYYRLKQIDLDGAYKYSNIIHVNFDKFSFNVYPNPVIDNSSVQFQLQETADVSMQVVSSTGKTLQIINKGILQPGTYSVPVSLNAAAKGTYFIKMFAGDKSYVQTVIK